jgi:hypothetical protein
MMRAMYSCVSCSEVSLPEAISACSWATVASLCWVGTDVVEALCPNAEAGASRAANNKIRIAGAFIFFLLGASVADWWRELRMRPVGFSRGTK